MLALLRRCPPRDSGQLLPVLQHLAPALQLPRAAASEEVHVRLLSCVAAALAHAAAAGEAAAATCSSSGRRGLGGAEGAGPGGGGEGAAGGTTVLECGAALCSESGAPLAGYLVHCSLEAAEREVMAGHQGGWGGCALWVGCHFGPAGASVLGTNAQSAVLPTVCQRLDVRELG